MYKQLVDILRSMLALPGVKRNVSDLGKWVYALPGQYNGAGSVGMGTDEPARMTWEQESRPCLLLMAALGGLAGEG